MRKVKLSMQMTINGYVAGPNGENDWMTWNPDDEFMEFLNAQYDASDTLLLGRKMANDFINYWEGAFEKNPTMPLAKKIVEMPKVVFTKTLTQSLWENTTLATGNLAEEITHLKNQTGKDILVVGGAGLASSLIKAGLINEYHLIINPTAMGKGMTIFNSLETLQRFTPIQAKLYKGGKTVLSYQAKTEF